MKTVFKKYRRKNIAEMRPYVENEDLTGVSISEVDIKIGSPMIGDMIARNPKNHNDQWLVAKAYFDDNFEPIESPEPHPYNWTTDGDIPEQIEDFNN